MFFVGSQLHVVPGSVFSHFLVQILQKCPLNRLEVWLSRSLCFDLTCDGARLVLSLPGEHLPARARQGNQLVLRLSLEMEVEGLETENLQVLLKRRPTQDSSRWKWSLESQEHLVLGQLDEMSSSALRAAEDLNFKAYHGEMEVSLSAAEIDVERTKVSVNDEESKPITSLRVLLKIAEDTELNMLQLTNEDWMRLANLLALVEVDYGLFALNPGGDCILFNFLWHPRWIWCQDVSSFLLLFQCLKTKTFFFRAGAKWEHIWIVPTTLGAKVKLLPQILVLLHARPSILFVTIGCNRQIPSGTRGSGMVCLQVQIFKV